MVSRGVVLVIDGAHILDLVCDLSLLLEFLDVNLMLLVALVERMKTSVLISLALLVEHEGEQGNNEEGDAGETEGGSIVREHGNVLFVASLVLRCGLSGVHWFFKFMD